MSEQYELISLAELIDQIKADLLAPRENPDPAFYIDGIEVTAQVVATRNQTEGGKAGIGLSVLGLKADAGVDTHSSLGGQATQTVTIKLSPLLSREDYLKQLGDDERGRIEQIAARVVTRGGSSADSV
jgi:hypothetical protein